MIPDSNILNNKRSVPSFSVQILSIFTFSRRKRASFSHYPFILGYKNHIYPITILAGQKKYFNVLGITTTSGNQTIEKTSRNALSIVEYLDLDIPVAKGASEPLIREVEVCEAIHGESGLDGFEFKPLKRSFDSRHAINFIIDTLLNSEE